MKREEMETLIKMNLSKDGKTLDLTAMHLKEAGAMTIAGYEPLKDITALELGRNIIGPKGAKYIAKSTILTRLTTLNLFYNNLGNEGAKYIAVSDNLVTLENLTLADNGIGDEGAKILAKFLPLYANLTRLDLRLNHIKEEGLAALREAQKMTQIKQLLLDKD